MDLPLTHGCGFFVVERRDTDHVASDYALVWRNFGLRLGKEVFLLSGVIGALKVIIFVQADQQHARIVNDISVVSRAEARLRCVCSRRATILHDLPRVARETGTGRVGLYGRLFG